MRDRALQLTAAALLALFGAAAACDWDTDAARFPAFRAAVAVAGLVVCAAVAACSRGWRPLAPWPAFSAAVWLLAWWDHSPVKPFARFHAAIQMGMTRAEVEAEMDRHYPPSGRHPRPEPFSVLPDQRGYKIEPPGWGDVMVINLYFDGDRVVYRSLHDD